MGIPSERSGSGRSQPHETLYGHLFLFLFFNIQIALSLRDGVLVQAEGQGGEIYPVSSGQITASLSCSLTIC